MQAGPNIKIKNYWEERARQHGDEPSATTHDVYLRELEISTIVQTLREFDVPENAHVLDIGCGDGYSTINVARAIPNFSFLGLDYSENMIKSARRRLALHPELENRLAFGVGDVMELDKACGNATYDVILTVRCLINLDSFENQSHAIAQIAERTKPNGCVIAIENFVETHENLNQARRRQGLPEISQRWHNLYFREPEIVASLSRFFTDISIKDFASSYYFATRVIYSAMCKMRGEEPDYHHEIHQLAPTLPWVGRFSPVRMVTMRKKTR